jgi:hypothetical protein
MMTRSPVKTDLGILDGRDCIYLDKLNYIYEKHTLTIEGELNGNLCEIAIKDSFIPYTIKFLGVLAIKMEELEMYGYSNKSSFEELKDSAWLMEASRSDKYYKELKHFIFATYDDVIEILCRDFEMVINIPK